MVSAGLDTVPVNLIMGLASLSSADGQRIQAKALKEIKEVYPNGDAWERCLVEEKVPFVTALVKETLRYWTVIPICLPRTSIKDIPYNGTVVPAGTTFFMARSCYIRGDNMANQLDRTHTPQTTTPTALRIPTSSSPSASSTTRKSVRLTTATARDLACAPALT